jgi:subtilisin family serine protease
VAPGSRVLAVRVLDDGLIGTYSDILEALDWVVKTGRTCAW